MSIDSPAGPDDAGGDGRNGVLIYRRDFLPRSETFIVDHIRALRRWGAAPVCDRLVPGGLGSDLPPPLVLRSGGAQRAARWNLQFAGRSAPLEALAQRRRVRLIHAHFLNDAARIVQFARRSRLPLVVTAHGYDATLNLSARLRNYDGRFMLLMRHRLRRTASRIVCVSDFIREELLRQGYPAAQLVTRRLGVDVARLRPGPPASRREGGLFVGRLVEKKGLAYLLRAWARLPLPLRSTPLAIVGEGPLHNELVALAAALDVPARFLGVQPQEAVLERMRAARLFAFPSARAANGDAEGMGVVAMEAQALGAPVVAFDGGTGPEVLADGVSGLLAPGRNVDALADAIARVLSDDALADRLGAAGPAIAAERFDLHRNTAALEDLYDEVTAEHGWRERSRAS